MIIELITSLRAGIYFSRGKIFDLVNLNTPQHFSR